MKRHGPEELRPARASRKVILSEQIRDLPVSQDQEGTGVPLDPLLGREENVGRGVEASSVA